jgi:hypothetical protein
VYNCEAGRAKPGADPSKDIVGGAAKFATLIERLKPDNPLVIFSGDAFNPSSLSTVTKGAHMVGVLNALGTAVSATHAHKKTAPPQAYPTPITTPITRPTRWPSWGIMYVDANHTCAPYNHAPPQKKPQPQP